MALTAKDLIDDAKGIAYPYIAEYAISHGALLRQLTALDEEVVNHFSLTAPERLSVAGTNVVITLANNAAGYVLTAARAYSDFELFDDQGERMGEVTIVPESKFDTPPVHPAGIVRGITFFPCDPLEKRWAEPTVDRVVFRDNWTFRYRYVAEPVRLTALANTLASPNEARQFFIWSLALGILLSTQSVLPVPAERLQFAVQQVANMKTDLGLLSVKRTGTTGSYAGGPYRG